jgi:hypothetical protein
MFYGLTLTRTLGVFSPLHYVLTYLLFLLMINILRGAARF